MCTVARRTSAIGLVLWVTVTGAAGAQARGPSYRHLCAVRRCQTLAVSPRAEVLRARQRRQNEEPYEGSFARLRGSERLVALGDELPGPTVGIRLRAVTLAGETAAYALTVQGEEPPDLWRVYRLNAHTGRREKFAAGPNGETAYPTLGGGVFQLAALKDGTIAWTVGGEVNNPAAREVMELAPDGKQPVVVAEDPGLEPKSLAITPGYLYWSASGTAHSQRLP
jgi:hypothetical protein